MIPSLLYSMKCVFWLTAVRVAARLRNSAIDGRMSRRAAACLFGSLLLLSPNAAFSFVDSKLEAGGGPRKLQLRTYRTTKDR